MNQHICEKLQIVPAFVPVNLAAGDNNGDWINMKDYGRCAIVFLAGVGAASQDPTLTLLQAQSNGGSSKALDFTRIDVKQASALTGVGEFTTVIQAAANSYTEATSGEKQKLWVIDVKAEDLDIDGGYDWIQASVGDPGTTSQLAAAIYLLHEPRYASATLPSAIG